MSLRVAPLVAGMLAIVAGALFTVTGSLIAEGWLRNLVLVLAGVFVFGVAVFGVMVRALEGGGGGGLPGEEFGPGVRTPGDGIDASFADAGGRLDGTQTDLRRRMEDAAVATLARRYGCSEAQAREMLDSGSWTEDETAAQFFQRNGEVWTVRDWLRSLLGNATSFEHRADRATRALLEDEP